MKKSILALFVLLFLFILMCVYQKTYQIYAKNNNNTITAVHTTSSIQPSESTVILPSIKKENTALKVETHKVVTIKSTPKEPHIAVEKKIPTTIPVVKAVKTVPVPKITSHKKSEEVKKKEITLSKPTPETKTALEKVNKPIGKKEPLKTMVPDTTVEQQKPSLKEDHDLKEIDSLMQALKDRDGALKDREELELRIQQLIKEALDNRFNAIAYMNKEELRLLDLQKELLNVRDIAYKKIGQTNTPTSGE